MAHTSSYEALVLRTMDLGEADRLCILFTREAGRKAARAKSVRKQGSRLGGVLLPFRHIMVELHEGKGGSMITAAMDKGDLEPPSDMDGFVRLEQGIELLLTLTEDDHPMPDVFRLLGSFIKRSTEPKALVVFHIRLLHLLGFLPSIDEDRRFQQLPEEVRAYIHACTHISDMAQLISLMPDDTMLNAFVRLIIDAQLSKPLKSDRVADDLGNS